MDFLIELIVTLFAEIIGAGIQAGIESGSGKSRKKKKRISKRMKFIEECEDEAKRLYLKRQIVIGFEKKRKAWILGACFFIIFTLILLLILFKAVWKDNNLYWLILLIAFVFFMADFLTIIWIVECKIIFDEEKFTIVSGVLPKRVVFHKDLDDIAIDKKGNDAVIIKFYIKGKKRVRFVCDCVDYGKIEKALDKFNSIKSTHYSR